MTLKTELKKLKGHIGKQGDGFDKQLEVIKANFTTEKDKEEINNFIRTELNNLTAKADDLIRELTVREQLKDISQILSLSYIAKNYFGKTKEWLYARINGNMVNGKPGKLKPKEIDILNDALDDIAKKIGSTKVLLS